jgi:hypothetical protein
LNSYRTEKTLFFTKTYEYLQSLVFASKENAKSTCDLSSLAPNTFYMESKIQACNNCLSTAFSYLLIPRMFLKVQLWRFRNIADMSVRPSVWSNSAPTGRIFIKFHISQLFKNLCGKLKFHYNLIKITATLHEDQYTFLIISRSIPLRMRNVSDKSCRENQNTHFIFNDFFSKIVLFTK